MPLLSFVLVVHGEQAYIEECAGSVLDQGFDDLELVVIDDASPDHGPAVLDRLAERDPRVRVEHLDRRIGRGAARNLGLERASGDYVWFLNTTDRLPAGAPARVAGELRKARPDVLLLHHVRVGALGQEQQGPHRKALAKAAEKGPGPLEQHRALAYAAPRAFDKVLRRGLLTETGARFGPAGHAELTVTWPALLGAERIAALPEKAYERRAPRNATPEPGSAFDVFDQYDAVLKEAGDRAGLVEPARRRHLLKLLDRVPAKDRREFFRRMSPGESYAAFRAREEAGELRRSLGRRRRAVKQRARRAARKARRARLERHYRAQLRRPIDPDLAVFAAYWYRAYSCNPRAIYERARELVPNMRGVWVVKADAVDAIPAGVDYVVAGTPEYFETIARARYFVNNVNFPNNLVKRDGTVHVMTHHGTPLKKMGLDQRESPVSGERTDFAALLERCARWDYSVSSNVFSTLVWERTFPLRYETLEVGYPRNDVLATATDADIQRIRAELGIGPDETAVLYAPTHREYHDGYVQMLDVAAVAEALGPGYVVLSRAHYFYAVTGTADARVRDVSAHPSVEELCLAANVLVTDYSSIMFDYGVLDRPIVIHAPDWEVYRTLRGTYFDLMEQPPGAITRTEEEVAHAIRLGDPAPDARAAFRARFCSLDDGRAAERVVRRVWFGERELAHSPEPAVVG
ncbi:MAG: CDP-glycerol glycerophosphotransferase [Thermoleophilaceae bacterium]|nr:CDP-glycerol glycerophosphotransferase [Thermoleophilaceae bacterium]